METEPEPEDFRTFVQQLMARSDRLMREIFERMDAGAAETRAVLREQGAVLREQGARMDAMIAQLVDMRDEQRAQTQALWRVIDRMDRLDGGGAAA